MDSIPDLEKKVNSELTTKIKFSVIKHSQLYINIDCKDLIDVLVFLKNNLSNYLKKKYIKKIFLKLILFLQKTL